MSSELIATEEIIQNKIFIIRNKKVMLDQQLAALYGVQTKNLNKAVKRNSFRFPDDFMFHLNKKEADLLRFQFGTSKSGSDGCRIIESFSISRSGDDRARKGIDKNSRIGQEKSQKN